MTIYREFTICNNQSSGFLIQNINNAQTGFKTSMCWNFFVDFDELLPMEHLIFKENAM